MSSLEPSRPRNGQQVSASELPGLARVAAASGLRLGAWAAFTGINAGRRAVDVVLHPEHAADLAEDLRYAASAITRALVGDEVEDRMRSAAAANPVVRAVAEAVETVAPHPNSHDAPPEDPLHAAAQDLLRRSRDVWSEDRGHPAYSRIIEELAPDEGRILVLLLGKGPQATVDVRSGGLLGTSGSTLVGVNLNMIGALAGCRYVDRVPSYLHNLERLGLIWFSSEMLRDPMEYQVLEAQPDVLDAKHSVRRAKVVRRSIQLTPFGEDFCRDGLGLPEVLAELEHPSPPEPLHRQPHRRPDRQR